MKRSATNRRRKAQLNTLVRLCDMRTVPEIARAMAISQAHAHRLLTKHGYTKVWVSKYERMQLR